MYRILQEPVGRDATMPRGDPINTLIHDLGECGQCKQKGNRGKLFIVGVRGTCK
jgi:hypothetical protein